MFDMKITVFWDVTYANRWKFTDVSVENVASIFRFEAKIETSNMQGARRLRISYSS
jgi:hypothetical protein